MNAPKIQTAIPKRRYTLGGYQVAVLGEIESGDMVQYRYILALVREGERAPSVYVTCEKNPRSRSQAGSHCLRLISEHFTEELGSSDAWSDLDRFVDEGLAVAAKCLGLAEERAVRVL